MGLALDDWSMAHQEIEPGPRGVRSSPPPPPDGGPRRLHVPGPAERAAASDRRLIEPPAPGVRYPAEFVVDLSGDGVHHSLRARQAHQAHGVYLASYSDVEVFGHHHLHAFVRPGDRFECQDLAGYEWRLRNHVVNHPGRALPMPQITQDGEDFYIDRRGLRDEDVAPIDESVLFATPTEPLNWGMWLLQAVPAAMSFTRDGLAEKLMIHAGTAWQMALLRQLGIGESRVIGQELGVTYRVRDLRVFQYTNVDLTPTANDILLLRQLAETLAPDADTKARRRIFLSRRTVTRQTEGRYRALLNEDEIVERMLKLGFEVHEPEALSFVDQIRLFRESELVVGLGGAALFNVVFCRPGTRVVTLESSAHFVHNHAALFAALGHRYGVVFGRQDPTDAATVHRRWGIDPEALSSIVRQF